MQRDWQHQLPLTNTGSIMSYVSILAESVGDVAIIRLNDQNSLNAISPQMVEELLDAFQQMSRSKRAIVLTGVGRAFCSGANLGSVTYDPSDSYDAGVLLESHYNPLMMMIRDLPVPFVTAVNGPAVGGGSTIALSGDLIIAAQDAYLLQALPRVERRRCAKLLKAAGMHSRRILQSSSPGTASFNGLWATPPIIAKAL